MTVLRTEHLSTVTSAVSFIRTGDTSGSEFKFKLKKNHHWVISWLTQSHFPGFPPPRVHHCLPSPKPLSNTEQKLRTPNLKTKNWRTTQCCCSLKGWIISIFLKKIGYKPLFNYLILCLSRFTYSLDSKLQRCRVNTFLFSLSPSPSPGCHPGERASQPERVDEQKECGQPVGCRSRIFVYYGFGNWSPWRTSSGTNCPVPPDFQIVVWQWKLNFPLWSLGFLDSERN